MKQENQSRIREMSVLISYIQFYQMTTEQMQTYKERKKRKDEDDARVKERIEATKVVSDILAYIEGIKYRSPHDENERGYNRGIDRAKDMIKSEFYYWHDM